MTALQDLLDSFRTAAQTNREAGTYFEELTICFLKTEPAYAALYREVLTYSAWAQREGRDARDVGIDLVAVTVDGDVHAIQCKLYPADYVVQKGDIDSFFTASGRQPFSRRIIVATTDRFGVHAEAALENQQPPVTKIDLAALEASVIDWSGFKPKKAPKVRDKKKLRLPDQKTALDAVVRGLGADDRGKLIMACGTGKTFTSLKIAETIAGRGKRVLFLVPSLALLSQSLTEWTQESETPLACFAVCSDTDVGKKRDKNEDKVRTLVHELKYPATTDAASLAKAVGKRHDDEHMTVVFSTYHSIEVLHRAQKDHKLAAFDLIICDEAHRTTGATFEDEEESEFVRIHDPKFVRGAKRLYMTATPRVYGDAAKATAELGSVTLASMDDEKLFGKNLYVLTFSEAVRRDLLVDYKVIVLSVDEKHVSGRIQNLLKDENNQLRMDDAAKIIGCWKALSKQGLAESTQGAPDGENSAMKRAVAFCQVIDRKPGARVHKVSSKLVAEMFEAVVEAYQETEPAADGDGPLRLRCEAEHVDGTMNASEKEAKIAWLKAEPAEACCRILSNVRCLSEGVDVPALDAVLFLTPRNSQVDVVQSVGRVMRKDPASGKKRGYVVLPVVIPSNMQPDEALRDNQVYKVVWQVLQALRSHDDRFDAMINKLDLTGPDRNRMEVIAVTDKIGRRRPMQKRETGRPAKVAKAQGGAAIGAETSRASEGAAEQTRLEFRIGEIERAIYARIVEKVGNRRHWEEWANDVASIARAHITRIETILSNKANAREREVFQRFARELRDDLNDSITDAEVVEMLAQHLVTRPVFEALFAGNEFAARNSMSQAMQGVLDALAQHHLEKETETLQKFYESVKERAEGITGAGRQAIVVELYDKFFRNAFPKMSERLGIVYTPIQIVDFILRSVDHVLRTEFGQTLGSPGVHILDPFVGTGAFITRLFQSGLLTREALIKKYRAEIHANEIVLLAYYIAAINIELAYHDVVGGAYEPFEGICLTDTFQLEEKDDKIAERLADNSARRMRQKKLDIRVIIGNPPYSIGQDSENDNNANVDYPRLDARIAETYVARSAGKLAKSLYDSYVRAIRWASDRLGRSGVIGFVTNANFIESSTADGLRKCLAEEFSSLYVFHLRGNQRTAGERSRREGGKVFGGGSRAPVAISLLVKNPATKVRGRIFFRDIGDYLTREQKLEAVSTFGSIAMLTLADGWTQITPDEHGDWLKQRSETFGNHLPSGIKDSADTSPRLFSRFSLGVVTNRDPWASSPSRRGVGEQIERMIAAYNAEVKRFEAKYRDLDKKSKAELVDDFIDNDRKKIAWTRSLKTELVKGTRLEFDERKIVVSLYRPFSKHWLYFDRKLNEMVYQMPRLFPHPESRNRVIGVSASESRSGFSVLMSDVLPSLHAADMVGSQFFPLYVYETDDEEVVGAEKARKPTSAVRGIGAKRRDGITDAGLEHFSAAYPGEAITKEDVFYYFYGILHSPTYRELYSDSLGKDLPRLPLAKTAGGFWAFATAGRALGELHIGYEKVVEYEGVTITGPKRPTNEQLRVEKMKFGKGKDKTIIHYNHLITISNIPVEAFDFRVNGKSAIEWVMDRQTVTTDPDSGILRDANMWAIETAGSGRYPLSLLLRVITVSLETIKIVRSLPPLGIED